MQVTFTRTGPRTYGIAADRGGGPVVHMPTGPGFDPWLPHDLVHFVVERHVGIEHGVFGQLAAGGTAGTVFTTPPPPRGRGPRRRGPPPPPAPRGRAPAPPRPHARRRRRARD